MSPQKQQRHRTMGPCKQCRPSICGASRLSPRHMSPWRSLLRVVDLVESVNARKDGVLRRLAIDDGPDLDIGMAGNFGDQWSHEVDAMTLRSSLSARSGLQNFLTAWRMQSEKREPRIFPDLRVGRDAVLRSLGRGHIGDGIAAKER